MFILWFISLVFLYVSFTDWFERASGGFLSSSEAGSRARSYLYDSFPLVTDQGPKRDRWQLSEVILRILGQVIPGFSVLGRFYAFVFVILFPVFAFLFYVERVYPKIPQEFGGAHPRPACLDLVKKQLSSKTIADLALPGSPAGDSILRSTQIEVLFSGSGVLVVRKDNRVYEITRSAVQAVTSCD